MAAYTTIDDPSLYFQIATWTGTGSSNSITLPGDTNMQPDMSWIKSRNSTSSHCINDSVRGVSSGNTIHSNNNGAEDTSNTDAVDSFDSDGVTLGADSGNLGVNYSSSQNYVGWFWKAGGGSGSSNEAGSINTTSTSVNTTSGFSISTYSGNDTAGATIGHGLGAVPHLILIKCRDASQSWVVYHHKNTSAPETDYLILDTTAATVDNSNRWNDTAPSSTLITLGDENQSNGNQTYVAYAWTAKQGFSKFGSYVGNGNADGPFVYTGFAPAYVLRKSVDTGSYSWLIQDWERFDRRNTGETDRNLGADSNIAEPSTAVAFQGNPVDFLSNGFKIKASDGTGNKSGDTYIYAAFAEAPFVNSNGVPCNAR